MAPLRSTVTPAPKPTATVIHPFQQMAADAAPQAVTKALRFIFSRIGDMNSVWLVGGTALSLYYARHRRSDDLDLFAKDALSYDQTVRAIKGLLTLGATIDFESHTPTYYHAVFSWLHHTFTVDVVLDEHLHQIGQALQTKDGVWVASLDTLLTMKIACLVSRASEKDLFDLNWLFHTLGTPSMATLIQKGNQIDGGLNLETLLISLKGATLRQEACHFALPEDKRSTADIFHLIQTLQQQLITDLLAYEKDQPSLPPTEALQATLRAQKQLT